MSQGLQVQRHFTTEAIHPLDTVTWGVSDVVIQGKDGPVFEARGVEFPAFWSQRARDIVASKYFRVVDGKRETSVKEIIERVVSSIASWGYADGYFDAHDARDPDSGLRYSPHADNFRAELLYILLHQYASFNSPVWFNVGVQEPPQTSACQPYTAMVNTAFGLVSIGELVEKDAIGIEVFDSTGLTTIVAAKTNGVREVFRVTLANGQYIEATGDHQVCAVHQRRTAPGWVRLDTLKPGMRLHIYTHKEEYQYVPSGNDVLLSEAALAGWLLTDGFVGQYNYTTLQSLIVEFETVNDAEFEWVSRHFTQCFPMAKPNIILEKTQDALLNYRRIRVTGERYRDLVQRYGLIKRKALKCVPLCLYSAPLNVVTAFLRSVFQADGYVSVRKHGACVGLQSVSQVFIEGIQLLLLRLGIYSRIAKKVDPRKDRLDGYCLVIAVHSERKRFAQKVGFIAQNKMDRLIKSLDLDGKSIGALREECIVAIASLGTMPVYDIQTASGHYLSNNIVVHNCYILDVEDSMESILEWYRQEGMIFKGGSGSGVNLSKIRSKGSPLSNGGVASGVMSFAKVADSNAGAIKSGGSTRRAAKLLVLDVEHPEIEDFIRCKVDAEKLAHILMQNGFGNGIEGGAYDNVPWQNANNSVSVTDAFMELAALPAPLGEKGLLLHKMAEAAWECGDPAPFFHDTVNKWHTTPSRGPIRSGNPCQEFLRPPNEACNLASINLLKFLKDDNTFDIPAFCHTVDIMVTAMDILIDHSSYPTDVITQNSQDYRPIGLGYSNLGALLMAKGLPYDSDEGRHLAGAITALLTGQAYKRSAEIAEVRGAFAGFTDNADAMQVVLARHVSGMESLMPEEWDSRPVNGIVSHAFSAWEAARVHGIAYGFRNCQVSVLAPCGTISFMMDCDTTGVEPCLGLVTTKKLVGGGEVKAVNSVVNRALQVLGYDERTRKAQLSDLEKRGAFVIDPEHLDVFATALGNNHISWQGHIKMVAAVQPFLSGGCSKTINMPHEATVQDVFDAYVMAWKSGLKAIAIYRDGSKGVQPVTVVNSTAQKGEEAHRLLDRVDQHSPSETYFPSFGSDHPHRQRLPDERNSITHKFTLNTHEGYLTVGLYDDGSPGELFVRMSKEGSTLGGLMDGWATMVSIALQYGVPLTVITQKCKDTQFEPRGFTGNPEIRTASSILDYIVRWLEQKFFVATQDRKEVLPDMLVVRLEQEEKARAILNGHSYGYLCPECGGILQRAGSCHVCMVCGTTSGCA